MEVVRLVVDGLSSREVAQQLCRSPRTIENHLHSVYQKVGVRNRVELVRAVSEQGLLHDENDEGGLFGPVSGELELKGRTLDVITEMDRRLARASNDDFLSGLAIALCEVVGIKWAGLTEPAAVEGKLDIICFAEHGKLLDQVQCDAAVSACGETLRTGRVVLSSGAQAAFPDWCAGKELGVEAYVGIRLDNPFGEAVGTLWVMHDRPVQRIEEVELVLRIFGRRTAAELALAQIMDRYGPARPQIGRAVPRAPQSA